MTIRNHVVLGACFALLWSHFAIAADPAVNCEAGKLKEAGKYSNCRLKADSKAVKTGESPDYSKCESKFSDKWQKTEGKGAGACPTNTDESSMNARITGDAADIATLLAGGTVAYCGDGVIDAGEDCDLTPGGLGGETCLTQGQVLGGLLQCGANCKFDYSGCTEFNYVFVTSATYDGNLGGEAGADANCQAHAVAAGLPGVYKAWISEDSTSSPSTTFTQSPSAYVLVNGTQVAASWADLTDGFLDAPIDVDETGASVAVSYVWTGTAPDGTWAPPTRWTLDCLAWTSNDPTERGLSGLTNHADEWWSAGGSPFCSDQLPLYCFQQ